MPTITVIPARFSNARSGTSLATCGQRDMWDRLLILQPHTNTTNILVFANLPAGMTPDQLSAVVTDLVLRHEALRTRYRVDADGVLWQELSASGDIPVEVWNASRFEDHGAAGDEAEAMLEATEFDLAGGAWPIRALIGAVEDSPKVLLLVMSHLAVDMLSARLVRRDLLALIAAAAAGRPSPELRPRRQPLDQAAVEASLASRRARDRELASWRRRLEEAPRTMYPGRPASAPAQRHQLASLDSLAASLAADVLAARYAVNSAVVVMAAQAVMLAHQAGLDRCSIQVSTGNRIGAELAEAVGSIRQHSLAVIDTADAGFEQVARRTWTAWLQAQRTGIFDPAEIHALRREVEWARGMPLDLTWNFNDLRVSRPRSRQSLAAVTPGQLADAAASTTFGCVPRDAGYAKLLLRLEDRPGEPGEGGRMMLHAYTDAWVMPTGRTHALLLGIERLLTWQAADPEVGPLDPARVTAVTGVAGPDPSADWAVVDGCRVDLAAATELLRAAVVDTCPELAAGGRGPSVAVRLEPLVPWPEDSGSRLVGYVAVPAGGRVPAPERLHESCMSRLRGAAPTVPACPPGFGWLAAMAPQQYIVVAQAGRRDAEPDWPDRRVLAEGTGRSPVITPG